MKTLKSILTLTAALFTLSSVAFALPAWKGGPPETAMKKGDFEGLKPGDKIALVCKASDSVTVIDIKDQKAAQELCQAGRMVHCPVCKKNYKTTWVNPSGKGPGPQTKVVIVNEKGEPCMFFAKLSDECYISQIGLFRGREGAAPSVQQGNRPRGTALFSEQLRPNAFGRGRCAGQTRRLNRRNSRFAVCGRLVCQTSGSRG